MAYYRIKFFSNSLKRNTFFEMFLPNDIREDIPHEDTVYSRRQMKTLFLLHGYTGCAENWVPEYLCLHVTDDTRYKICTIALHNCC